MHLHLLVERGIDEQTDEPPGQVDDALNLTRNGSEFARNKHRFRPFTLS